MIFLIMSVHSIRSHPGGHDSDDEDEDSGSPSLILNDVKHLFLKYTNGSHTSRMNINEFVNSFIPAHLSQLHTNSPPTSQTGGYSCYASRLDDLSVRLSKLNRTGVNNNYLDEGRLAKVSSFLIANFDKCFGGKFPTSPSNTNISHHGNQKSLIQKIMHNLGHLNKEGWLSSLIEQKWAM